MKKIFSMILVILLCFCMCACSASEEDQPESKETQEAAEEKEEEKENSDAMPVFSATDLDGNTVTSDIFSQADITVVNFWATYCRPCINEMPELAEWQESMPENVQIIGIVVDTDTAESDTADLARQIVDQTGVKYQNLVASDDLDAVLGEIIGVPTTYFVDKEGHFVGNAIIGANVKDYKQRVEAYLQQL